MADEDCAKRKLAFSGTVTVGNLINAAVILAGMGAFMLQAKSALDTLEKGLIELKVEFRAYKGEVREDIRDINKVLLNKADR